MVVGGLFYIAAVFCFCGSRVDAPAAPPLIIGGFGIGLRIAFIKTRRRRISYRLEASPVSIGGCFVSRHRLQGLPKLAARRNMSRIFPHVALAALVGGSPGRFLIFARVAFFDAGGLN